MFAAKADKYLLAAQDKGPYDGLDAETIQKFRNYLKKKDRLAKINENPNLFRAELIAVQEEKKEIDDTNNIRLGGSKERRDLSQADLLSLAPDKFYLWRDFYRNGGVFHYAPGKIDRFLEGQWRDHLNLLKQIVEVAQKAANR